MPIGSMTTSQIYGVAPCSGSIGMVVLLACVCYAGYFITQVFTGKGLP